ncbi:uncharacterized protein NPIL_558751 [Nephila pilipes]|uniref:Uncharacterized protein n=1 Tax=Nephila pilipes TaxID=299642 RepID=A0A8X6UCV9_NEPPI|nr:uncharacterized protein NPIL_558751 [Nephila pilipes]
MLAKPFSSQKFLLALALLDLNKSPGPHGLHGQMLESLGTREKQRLLHIINLSWKIGRLPPEGKRAKVIPIKKPEPEFTSKKRIDYLVLKSRKRLNILKYIAGKNCGADAATLRLTYLTLIHPILEYGFPIYCCASNSVLKKLKSN